MADQYILDRNSQIARVVDGLQRMYADPTGQALSQLKGIFTDPTVSAVPAMGFMPRPWTNPLTNSKAWSVGMPTKGMPSSDQMKHAVQYTADHDIGEEANIGIQAMRNLVNEGPPSSEVMRNISNISSTWMGRKFLEDLGKRQLASELESSFGPAGEKIVGGLRSHANQITNPVSFIADKLRKLGFGD